MSVMVIYRTVPFCIYASNTAFRYRQVDAMAKYQIQAYQHAHMAFFVLS